MNIKKSIKISFLIISISILFIFIFNTIVLYQIKENNKFKKDISTLIFMQNSMNDLTEKLLLSTELNELLEIKDSFIKYEKSFEKLYSIFFTNQINDFVDNFIKDIHEEKDIKISLDNVLENEKTIEKYFDKLYAIQNDKIKYKSLFETIYPKENNLRKDLEKLILDTNNINLIKKFGDMKYYSKEVLFQKKNYEYLNKWTSEIDIIAKEIETTKFMQYKDIVIEIASYAIKIESLNKEEQNLQNEIKIILDKNNELNNFIENKIDELSNSFTDKFYSLIIIILISTILFIIFLSIKVSKNVGLSVDEIETKVQNGLKEIKNLNKEIENTQKEVVFTMGAIGESRSKETGNHVKRVAEYSKLFALKYGLDYKEAEMIKQASPMHDIGKVAIPDNILNKPGRFDDEERKIMNSHAKLGFEMLKHSNRPILKCAATVAYEHHEKWDGTGYPSGLKGEEIHIYGRITALADVFDALGSDRCYKKAWNDEKIFNLFRDEKGKHFDPKLVDIFFDNLNDFLEIREKFKDI